MVLALVCLVLTYLVCALVYESYRAQYHGEVGLSTVVGVKEMVQHCGNLSKAMLLFKIILLFIRNTHINFKYAIYNLPVLTMTHSTESILAFLIILS